MNKVVMKVVASWNDNEEVDYRLSQSWQSYIGILDVSPKDNATLKGLSVGCLNPGYSTKKIVDIWEDLKEQQKGCYSL